ncbi:unnamed protein product, partial [Trichogramma brassicae]
ARLHLRSQYDDEFRVERFICSARAEKNNICSDSWLTSSREQRVVQCIWVLFLIYTCGQRYEFHMRESLGKGARGQTRTLHRTMDMSDDDDDLYQSSNENIYECDCFFGGGDNAGDKINHDDLGSEDEADRDSPSSERLKDMREKVDWKTYEERRKFFRRLVRLIDDWKGPGLSNLREIFCAEEIECLLLDHVYDSDGRLYVEGRDLFIDLLIDTCYKDEPEVDSEGKTLLRRTTPIHRAATCSNRNREVVIRRLFEIYDRFDVNYIDEESGLTHFHVACKFGCDEAVKKFLEFGQDPDCPEPRTGQPPLHLALKKAQTDVVAVLLRAGADPNLANDEGRTPLHMISNRDELYDTDNDCLMETFFKVNDELKRPVRIDARDNEGRTPLQWAVAKIEPRMVEILLARVADLSSFRFPDGSYFGGVNPPRDWEPNHRFRGDLKSASGALMIVESLENKGYVFDPTEALTIMGFFFENRLLDTTDDDDEDDWYDDENFLEDAGQIIIGDMLLDDLVRSPPEEVAKKVKFEDYFEYARVMPDELAGHVCETMSRGFFRRWALDAFRETIRSRHWLSEECCKTIVAHLKNKDLYNVCLAVTGARYLTSWTCFAPREIDWLLSRDATSLDYGRGKKFIEFAVRCGYKDKLDLDDATGKPRTARRTTPVHLAAEHGKHDLCVDGVLRELFEIYDRFDVNYLAEELGTTHFHLACRYDIHEVVKKFLELGQVDPDSLEPRTGKSPIYLALKRNGEDVLAALLRHGADPNLAPRSDGRTPLHWICTRFELYDCDDYRLMAIFFRVCDELRREVLVDARDSEGRTPLQWAVARIQPRMVRLILSHGADLAKFSFPDDGYFGRGLRPPVDWEETNYELHNDVKVASGAMMCVEKLVEAGYELGQGDAMTIMRFFVRNGYTEIPAEDDDEAEDDEEEDDDDFDDDDDDDHDDHDDPKKYWYDDEEFSDVSCDISIGKLSLDELIRKPAEEVAEVVEFDDYHSFGCHPNDDQCRMLPESHTHILAAHLCEKMSRGFFRRWSLDPFHVELMSFRLPKECCEMIIRHLTNRDLYNVCLALRDESQLGYLMLRTFFKIKCVHAYSCASPTCANVHTDTRCGVQRRTYKHYIPLIDLRKFQFVERSSAILHTIYNDFTACSAFSTSLCARNNDVYIYIALWRSSNARRSLSRTLLRGSLSFTYYKPRAEIERLLLLDSALYFLSPSRSCCIFRAGRCTTARGKGRAGRCAAAAAKTACSSMPVSWRDASLPLGHYFVHNIYRYKGIRHLAVKVESDGIVLLLLQRRRRRLASLRSSRRLARLSTPVERQQWTAATPRGDVSGARIRESPLAGASCRTRGASSIRRSTRSCDCEPAPNLFKATTNRKLKETVALELSFVNSNLQLLKEQLAELNSSVEVYQNENSDDVAMPLIPLGLKETKDIDFRDPFKDFILEHYSEDGENYEEAIAEFMETRMAMRTPTRDVAGIGLLMRYYNQLYFIERRFFPPERSLGIYFEWYDSLTGVPSCQRTVAFEKASVLFNAGALYTQVAAKQDRKSPKGLDQAVDSFLRSAGTFRYIQENFTNAPSMDLGPDMLDMLVQLMLAQARECLFEKLELQSRDARDAEVSLDLAQEAAQVSAVYADVHAMISREPVRDYVPESWIALALVKREHYLALAHRHCAAALLDHPVSEFRAETRAALERIQANDSKTQIDYTVPRTENDRQLLGRSHVREALVLHEESQRLQRMCRELKGKQSLTRALRAAQDATLEIYGRSGDEDDLRELLDSPSIVATSKFQLSLTHPDFGQHNVDDLFKSLGPVAIFSAKRHWTAPRLIQLQRGPGGEGFGFSVRGDSPVIIAAVDHNSLADLGGMKEGDFIVNIADKDVKWAAHEQVVRLIKQCGDSISLKLVTPMDRNYLKKPAKTSSSHNHRDKGSVSASSSSGVSSGQPSPAGSVTTAHVAKRLPWNPFKKSGGGSDRGGGAGSGRDSRDLTFDNVILR